MSDRREILTARLNRLLREMEVTGLLDAHDHRREQWVARKLDLIRDLSQLDERGDLQLDVRNGIHHPT
jgi:hypothetical protein